MRQALHYVSHASGLTAMLSRGQRAWRIVMFHGVGTPTYPPEVFEAQVRYLRRHFDLRSLTWLASRALEGAPPRGEVALTFDDGLRNNCTTAYPILKSLGAPATFFVCPGLVGTGKWLWNHEARQRLVFLAPQDRSALGDRLGSPRDVEGIISWMKTLSRRRRESAEDAIREFSRDFAPNAEQHLRYDLASWEELSSLDPEIVAVGSHTMNHPILSTLEAEELPSEIVLSRQRIEEELHRPALSFCYPNGSMSPEADALVRKTYSAAVTSETSFVMPGQDPYTMPRVPSSPRTELLSWRLVRPAS